MMPGSRLLSHRHVWHGGPRVCGGDPVSQMARRSQLVQDEDASCRGSHLMLILLGGSIFMQVWLHTGSFAFFAMTG